MEENRDPLIVFLKVGVGATAPSFFLPPSASVSTFTFYNGKYSFLLQTMLMWKIMDPWNNHLFKVSNWNTKKKYVLKINNTYNWKMPTTPFWWLYYNFENLSHLFLVFFCWLRTMLGKVNITCQLSKIEVYCNNS